MFIARDTNHRPALFGGAGVMNLLSEMIGFHTAVANLES
jgi:hypothetical protein